MRLMKGHKMKIKINNLNLLFQYHLDLEGHCHLKGIKEINIKYKGRKVVILMKMKGTMLLIVISFD